MKIILAVLLFIILESCKQNEGKQQLDVSNSDHSDTEEVCLNPEITIVDSGFYKAKKGNESDAKNVASGYTTLVWGKELLTDNIATKAKLNLNFGFRYKLKCSNDIENVPVKIQVIHPEIINPNTKVGSVESFWENDAWTSGVNYHTGWEMGYSWEVIPGEYKISLIINNKELVEKVFNITNPESMGLE